MKQHTVSAALMRLTTPPSSAYRRSHACTVCRETPYRRATSVTDAPSRTSSTARYRCSATDHSRDITAPFDAR